MLFHLIKKDLLISKKYVVLVFIIALAIPLFILWRSPQFSGVLGFALSAIFSEFMLCQNLSMKENQYSKANALLCSTPYLKSYLVIAKYVLFIGIFGYCVLAYILDLLISPKIGSFNLNSILEVFLVVSIAYGVYLPIQYQMGYEKTKLFFMIIIMVSPFTIPALVKYGKINLFITLPPAVCSVLLFGMALLVLFISAIISIRIFENKELV